LLRLQVLICVLLSLSVPAGGAQERPLRICVSERDYPPLTFPDRDGPVQSLIRRAVAQAGGHVEYSALPWRRCLHQVLKGELDGVATVAATEEHLVQLALPLHEGAPDPGKAVGQVVAVAFRRRDSPVKWDGMRFSGLRSPIIYEAGIAAFTERLAQLGQSGIGSANSPEQLMRMLLAGRAELALGLDPRVSELLSRSEFSALERLPVNFMQSTVYLAFNKDFYARESERLERLWSEIERLRVNQEWQKQHPEFNSAFPAGSRTVPPNSFSN